MKIFRKLIQKLCQVQNPKIIIKKEKKEQKQSKNVIFLNELVDLLDIELLKL